MTPAIVIQFANKTFLSTVSILNDIYIYIIFYRYIILYNMYTCNEELKRFIRDEESKDGKQLAKRLQCYIYIY